MCSILMNTFVITLISAVFSQAIHTHFYSKSMILILDTIEDEEIGWDKDNICVQAAEKNVLIVYRRKVKMLGLTDYKS